MNSGKSCTVWILGDQLSLGNAALATARKGRDRLLFIESRKTFGKLPYHRHRLLLILSAMRHFSEERRAEGWEIEYHRLSDAPDTESVLARHCAQHHPAAILLTEPNNHGERSAAQALSCKLPVPLTVIPTSQFLCSRERFESFAQGKKRLLMENFYREMRRQTGLLLESDGSPTGGSWNYDAENRATFRDWEKAGKPIPEPLPREAPDQITREVAADLEHFFPGAIGKAEDFALPVTRSDALAWLKHFVTRRLPEFGTWQDLMVSGEADMFHSILSPLLNIGLLDPLECAKVAEQAHRDGKAPLHAVEGFIRQIIGWREFVNGVYWLKMPEYEQLNGLDANRPLPRFFWDGDTDLNCLRQVLGETFRNGFNHHIQRLMILGNFLLLAGIRPQEALHWFNALYIDAHEWVMAANVLGMALHADGGFMATKPYAGAAAYIGRMSNYCEGCTHNPAIKSGEGACPFNLLYWNFYETHRERFANNPRTAMMVRSWMRRTAEERASIIAQSKAFLESLL